MPESLEEIAVREATTPDEAIVREAQGRFDRVMAWEANARNLFIEDIKFANADSDNGFQWPNDLRRNRDIDERPVLTVNKTRQHNLQIINDAKQNKPSIKISAVGDEATFESAQIFEGICRHIEYISNAQAAYDTATTFQVQGGIGYWRIVTDYIDDDSFDQDIFIKRVKDPLTVACDSDIQEADGSDMRYAFVFVDIPRDEYNQKYPEFKDDYSGYTLNDGVIAKWTDDEHVRVAEYYRIVLEDDELVAFNDPKSGKRSPPMKRNLLKKSFPKDYFEAVMNDPNTKKREVFTPTVEWYLIGGTKVIDRKIWPGKYIPIVRVIGEEVVIEGQLDRKGHTRAMKDPQRIYNYWTSSAVEQVALQGKIPFVGPAAAIEGLETYWESANRVNHSILPYNHKDDAGNDIPAPQRAQAPVMAQAYIQGMQVASDELRQVSGQYQSEMGAPSNERSAVAITARQRQGDNATYHYIDNLALGIRYTGRIMIDLIPKIYDTPRVIKILAKDGVEKQITIDPQAKQALQQKTMQQNQQVQMIFNPSVGKYDVEADVGPAFATRRQEAFNAFMQIISQAPEALNIAGDLMFKNADFAMADELAERWRRSINPALLGEGPTANEQQMQQQIQQMQQVIQQLGTIGAEKEREIKSYRQGHQVDAYNAETNRLKVIHPDMKLQAELLARLLLDTLRTDPNASPEPPQNGLDQPANTLTGPSPMNQMPGGEPPQPMEQAA